jgi:methyl-accepting chemotaxis protein
MREPSNPSREPSDPIAHAAASLRGLIREAAGEADLLRAAADEAAGVRASLSDSAAEIEAKLSRFAGLVPIIEERLREVETLLSASAAYAARAAQQAQAELDSRIAEAVREHLRTHLLRDIQPQIERLIAARLDGFLTDFGALTFPEGRRAA